MISISAHPFAKQLPFLRWLYDHSTKAYVWATNLAVLHALFEKRTGISTLLSYLAQAWNQKKRFDKNGLGKTNATHAAWHCFVPVVGGYESQVSYVSISLHSSKRTTSIGLPRLSATRHWRRHGRECFELLPPVMLIFEAFSEPARLKLFLYRSQFPTFT